MTSSDKPSGATIGKGWLRRDYCHFTVPVQSRRQENCRAAHSEEVGRDSAEATIISATQRNWHWSIIPYETRDSILCILSTNSCLAGYCQCLQMGNLFDCEKEFCRAARRTLPAFEPTFGMELQDSRVEAVNVETCGFPTESSYKLSSLNSSTSSGMPALEGCDSVGALEVEGYPTFYGCGDGI
eukprot:g79909.t1